MWAGRLRRRWGAPPRPAAARVAEMDRRVRAAQGRDWTAQARAVSSRWDARARVLGASPVPARGLPVNGNRLIPETHAVDVTHEHLRGVGPPDGGGAAE